MNYFQNLKAGDKTFSHEQDAIVEVLMTEKRNGILYITCETISSNPDDVITFDAVDGELRAPTWVDELPELKHCYSPITLKEAVQMVVNSARVHQETLSDISEVKAWLAEDIRHSRFNWITGERAMEIITAYTDNKPIREVAVP